MKKEYIKPVMESEMFVANEYVGACYLIMDSSCNHLSSPELIKNVSSEGDALDKFDSIYGGKHISTNGNNLYFGDINGFEGVTDSHSTRDDWLTKLLIYIYNQIFNPPINEIGVHHDLTCVKTAPNDSYDNIGPNAS